MKLLKGLDDGNPNIRNASAKAIGSLVSVVGNNEIEPVLEELDNIKKSKLKENYPDKNKLED